MKPIAIQLATVFLLLCLSGCVATESPATSSEMSSESISGASSVETSSESEIQIDPTETKQIIESLMADYEKTLFVYPNLCNSIAYSMDENGVIHDNLTEYWKVDTTLYFQVAKNETCNSIQDITTLFEKVYTKDFLQKHFYSYALEGYLDIDDETYLPVYRERNGLLYVQDVAAISGLDFPIIETIVPQSISDTKIVFNAEMQGCDTPFPIRMTLTKTEVGWRINECVYTAVDENGVS